MMKLRDPMRLSEKTLKILQNFTTINQSLSFKEGNKIRTISVMKNVLAEAGHPIEIAVDLMELQDPQKILKQIFNLALCMVQSIV